MTWFDSFSSCWPPQNGAMPRRYDATLQSLIGEAARTLWVRERQPICD
jgi:hypothetical protein